MAEYQNTIITNAGISLLNRILTSKATMTFTRAVSSTADLSGKTEADLRNMTSLSNIMQNGICSRYDVHSQNMVSLDLVFTNKDLGNSYLINTVGLYAQPSDSNTEILYAIAIAGKDSNGNSLAEQMPAYVDSKLTEFTISLFTQVGQSSSVAVSITSEGVVKSINSLTPDDSGNVVVDTSSHAKAIQEQLNSGKLYIPLLDDSGNPLTDESGNVLLNIQYLPKTISINGGQQVEADSSNNIDLQTYTKQDINNQLDSIKLMIDQSKAYTDDAVRQAWTPTVITTPVDLNTLTTCGSYFIQNALGTTTNTPIPNSWLFVRVEGVPTRITQTVWKDIDPTIQWVRLYTGTWGNLGWGDWTQITKPI